MRILSIQSHVTFGHAGNSAAVFPMQRLGHEVYPIHTVLFATHTGYGPPRGPMLRAEDISSTLDVLAERGVLGRVDAVLSGYLGTPQLGAAVGAAVDRVRAANPAVRYCCDPVIGSAARGRYVGDGVPEMFAGLLRRADVATPNQFELQTLTGVEVRTGADVLQAARRLRADGPGTVLVTSVMTSDTPNGSLQMVCVTGDGAWSTTTPLLPVSLPGSGDLAAALFLAHLLAEPAPVALARTTAAVHAVLSATAAAGSPEMLLVQAQQCLVAPAEQFPVVPIA